MHKVAWLGVFLAACSGSGSTTTPEPGVDAAIDAAQDAGTILDGSPSSTIDAARDGGASVCRPSGTCSPFDSDACQSGHSCLRMNDTWTCVMLASETHDEGQACQGDAQCKPGLACFGSTGNAVCRQLCPADSAGFCDDANNRCTGDFGDDCVMTCRPRPATCDIYAQNCSDTALACTLVTDSETGDRYTGCRAPGTQTEGQACSGSSGSCERGLICITSDDHTSACRQVCNPDGSPQCSSSDRACTGFAAPWDTGYCKPVL